MAEQLQVYKCENAPFSVEVLNPKGECKGLECCGNPMKLMQEKTEDTGAEKHGPIITEGKEGVKISVGSVPHPMEENHYIEWIEVINSPYVNKMFLVPGQTPEAEFYVPNQEGLIVRAYCNVHGLWRAK